MKSRRFRVWVMVALTLALGAAIIRLIWEITFSPSVGSLAVIILLLVAAVSTYVLFLYLTIKPSLKKLRSLPVAIATTVITVGGTAGGVIHFIRFVSSPQASSPLSVLVASVLLGSGLVTCGLILWVAWRFRGSGKE